MTTTQERLNTYHPLLSESESLSLNSMALSSEIIIMIIVYMVLLLYFVYFPNSHNAST